MATPLRQVKPCSTSGSRRLDAASNILNLKLKASTRCRPCEAPPCLHGERPELAVLTRQQLPDLEAEGVDSMSTPAERLHASMVKFETRDQTRPAKANGRRF